MARKKIGVFLNATDRYFADTFLRTARAEARRLRYDIWFFLTSGFSTVGNEYDAQEKGMFTFAPVEKMDGLIVVPDGYEVFGYRNEVEEAVQERARCPVVSLRCNDGIGDQVYLAEDEAIRPLIRHVLEKHGARRVGFMAGFPEHMASVWRLKCYREEMAAHGLEIPDNAVFQGHMWYTDGPDAYEFFFGEGGMRPEAVICANDYMAEGLMDALNAHGLRVPEDVIITGFDHSAPLTGNCISLSTVEQDYTSLIEAAFDQMDFRIREREEKGRNTERVHVKVPARMILGESCGCRKTGNQDLEHHLQEESARLSEMNLWTNEITYAGIGMSSCDSLEQLHRAMLPRADGERLGREDSCLCLFEEKKEEDHLLPQREGHYFAEHMTRQACLVSAVHGGKDGGMPLISFDSRELLPEEIWAGEEPGISIVSLLHQQRYTYGYLVTRPNDNIIPSVFSQLRSVMVSGAVHDIHDRETLHRLYEERRVISITDALTGIYNRRGMEEQVRPLWKKMCRRHETVAFIYLDMDRLKKMNDTFGHAAGDEAICMIAKALRMTRYDGAVYARMGGDEFLVFLPRATEESAETYISRFRANMDELNAGVAVPFRVSVTAGASVVKLEGNSELEQCIRKSDMIMYERKVREASDPRLQDP